MSAPQVGWSLVKETFWKWQKDNAADLSAMLAYYTLFSLAPLLVITVAVAGLAFGEQAVRGEIVGQIRDLVGEPEAVVIETVLRSARQPDSGIVATLIGFLVLLFGASKVFAQLQGALNLVWGVPPKPWRGILALIKDRSVSFAITIGMGFLLLSSLVASAVLNALGKFFQGLVPVRPEWLEIANFFISFGVITLLFAVIYKVLPEVRIAWRDVGFGAAITALLFTVGKTLIGLYLGRASVGSAYGAASSLVVLLFWVYWSAQLFFFGAEFTKTYADKYGSRRLGRRRLVAGFPIELSGT